MIYRPTHAAGLILSLMLPATLLADEKLFVFPADGQTPDQQKQDEYECYRWASGQTGFDPVLAAQQPAPSTSDDSQAASSETKGNSTGKAIVRGAAAGAVVAEVTGGEADDGAGYGAAAGLLKSRRNKKQQEKEATQKKAQAEQQAKAKAEAEAAALTAKRDEYKRAITACLEGKGYTVK